MQFSNENPPWFSWATIPPTAAILENFRRVILSMHVLTIESAGTVWTLLPSPTLLFSDRIWRKILNKFLPLKFSTQFKSKSTVPREQALTFALLKFLGLWLMVSSVSVSWEQQSLFCSSREFLPILGFIRSANFIKNFSFEKKKRNNSGNKIPDS